MESASNQPNAGSLNAEQINNWRNLMCAVLGLWALLLPDDEVQRIRDEMQRHGGVESANNLST